MFRTPDLCPAAFQAVIEAGARRARPGEFTLRAFLNGRLDLSQVGAAARLGLSTAPTMPTPLAHVSCLCFTPCGHCLGKSPSQHLSLPALVPVLCLLL